MRIRFLMGTMKTKTIGLAAACWLLAAGACFAASPMMGTWKFNDAKSKIAPGAGHQTTVVYTSALMGKMKCTVDGVDPSGKPTHNEWTGKFDGKDYSVTGDPTADARSYRMVNDRAYDISEKKNGKIVGKVRIVISADGKSRTVTIHGTTPAGKKFTNVEVYDKV
jgi:hypothetical protein